MAQRQAEHEMYLCDYSFSLVGVGPPTVNHDIQETLTWSSLRARLDLGFNKSCIRFRPLYCSLAFGEAVFSEGSRAEEL